MLTASTMRPVSGLILEIVTARNSHSPRSAKVCSIARANTSSTSPLISVSKMIGVCAWVRLLPGNSRAQIATRLAASGNLA